MFTMLLCAEHIIPIAGEPIDDGAVLVRDGRIVEVGGAQRMKAHYPQEEVRDFGRSAIMPGFVDCHTHLEYTALRGIVHDVPYAEWLVTEHAKADMMSRDDRYDSAVIGGMEMIAGGVTTVADFTSTGSSIAALARLRNRRSIPRLKKLLPISSVGVLRPIPIACKSALHRRPCTHVTPLFSAK